MEFAQSKGNARKDGSTGVTFSDVGGLGNTISEMMQVVEVSARTACVSWHQGQGLCSAQVIVAQLQASCLALGWRGRTGTGGGGRCSRGVLCPWRPPSLAPHVPLPSLRPSS